MGWASVALEPAEQEGTRCGTWPRKWREPGGSCAGLLFLQHRADAVRDGSSGPTAPVASFLRLFAHTVAAWVWLACTVYSHCRKHGLGQSVQPPPGLWHMPDESQLAAGAPPGSLCPGLEEPLQGNDRGPLTTLHARALVRATVCWPRAQLHVCTGRPRACPRGPRQVHR